MGASQSGARKITVDNPEEGGAFIKITENVVGRLREGATTNRSESVEPKSANVSSSDTKSISNAEDAVFVTSRHIRRQLEDQLERTNLQWENRMKAMRDGYRKINEELERGYKATVAEANSIHSSAVPSTTEPSVSLELSSACKLARSNVIRCYNSNKTRTLACSRQVEQFNEFASSGIRSTLLKVE